MAAGLADAHTRSLVAVEERIVSQRVRGRDARERLARLGVDPEALRGRGLLRQLTQECEQAAYRA
ncbi:MAG: hypothetical protein ACRDYX_12505 [Egibacteraceae bacterium]